MWNTWLKAWTRASKHQYYFIIIKLITDKWESEILKKLTWPTKVNFHLTCGELLSAPAWPLPEVSSSQERASTQHPESQRCIPGKKPLEGVDEKESRVRLWEKPSRCCSLSFCLEPSRRCLVLSSIPSLTRKQTVRHQSCTEFLTAFCSRWASSIRKHSKSQDRHWLYPRQLAQARGVWRLTSTPPGSWLLDLGALVRESSYLSSSVSFLGVTYQGAAPWQKGRFSAVLKVTAISLRS